jgi:glycosyltransferase involved in cell wall biosynthesis
MHASLPKLMGSFSFGNYRPVISVMKIVERLVLKTCDVVLTVGIDLEELVLQINPTANQIRIENIAIRNEIPWDQQSIEELRRTLVPEDKLVVVYTGTFEGYQGLEMLFASMQTVVRKEPNVMFVMVGGSSTQVAYWQQEISQLDLTDHVVFIGTVALDESLRYLDVADILVSPRTGGPSVPLKIYSYLQSGKPMVATNIYAHTQVLDETTAVLTDPTPAAFAEGLLQLIADPELRHAIGQNARAFVEREYSWESYLEKLEHAYLSIKHQKPISDIRSSDIRARCTVLTNL